MSAMPAPIAGPSTDAGAAHSRILILDFGSQVTQLIARRVREAHVYCEIHPNDVSDAFVREFAPKGIILSGSHASTYEARDLRAPQAVWDIGVPVLGICYGMFTMAVQQGGEVEPSTHREFGYAEVRARGHTKLLDGIEDFATADGHGMLKVWMSHGDKVTALPPGFKLMASTPSCPIAGIADEARSYLRRAVPSRSDAHDAGQGAARALRARHRRRDARLGDARPRRRSHGDSIRRQVGDEEVILGLSGGVDSSVAAALIHRAIGDQLTCVFVDHGLLRQDEAALVMEMFAGRLHARVLHVDASAQFLGKLAGVSDPEAKRKIIGREFVEVFQSEARKLKHAKWLAQGTIYPDVIESAGAKTKKAMTIKSHHNVGGLAGDAGTKAAGTAARTCSRTKCGSSARLSDCRATSCTAIRFPDPALACAFLARSSTSTPTCCAGPTRFSSKSFATRATKRAARAGTTSPAKPSPFSCP